MKMKEYAVWLVLNGKDHKLGKVTASDRFEAYRVIPKKYKVSGGKILLIPIVIEE